MEPERIKKAGEAPIGFEPMHKGFADLSLTTWVRRHQYCRLIITKGRQETGVGNGFPWRRATFFPNVRARALTVTPTGEPVQSQYRPLIESKQPLSDINDSTSFGRSRDPFRCAFYRCTESVRGDN